MNIYRISGWLVAGALAIGVGASSHVVANQVKAPAVAYAVGFPPNGMASANYAVWSLSVRALKDPKTEANSDELALARQAYRSEPLSSAALSLIVMTMPAGEARNALLTLAGNLTRRNALVNNEQMKLAAERGDDSAFFRWLSRSVLTNSELRSGYVGAMAQATAKDAAVDALTPVVGPAPAWSDYYWRQILRNPPSFANAAKLRVAIAGAPWQRTEITTTDRQLALALVGRAQFDSAYQMYRGLTQAEEPQGANLISNGDFTREPELPPFDWQVAVSGSLGASINTRDKRLFVSAIGGARGYAARQLLRLSPGNYRFGWALSASSQLDLPTMKARVYCAERGVKVLAPPPIALTAGIGAYPIEIADSPCRWYWVSIDVALPDESAGSDAFFTSISLVGSTNRRAADAPALNAEGATDVDRD